MKHCNQFLRNSKRSVALHGSVEGAPLRFFERVCVIMGPVIFGLLGCGNSSANDNLRQWHIEAIGVQRHISRALAYYEVAAASVRYGHADISLCGPETLNKVLLPAAEKLTALAASTPPNADTGDVKNTLGEVGKLLDTFRRKSVNKWNEAMAAADLRPEDHCMHAEEIVPIRADIEDLFETVLVATTPR